jgi:hypothetical protein
MPSEPLVIEVNLATGAGMCPIHCSDGRTCVATGRNCWVLRMPYYATPPNCPLRNGPVVVRAKESENAK